MCAVGGRTNNAHGCIIFPASDCPHEQWRPDKMENFFFLHIPLLLLSIGIVWGVVQLYSCIRGMTTSIKVTNVRVHNGFHCFNNCSGRCSCSCRCQTRISRRIDRPLGTMRNEWWHLWTILAVLRWKWCSWHLRSGVRVLGGSLSRVWRCIDPKGWWFPFFNELLYVGVADPLEFDPLWLCQIIDLSLQVPHVWAPDITIIFLEVTESLRHGVGVVIQYFGKEA